MNPDDIPRRDPYELADDLGVDISDAGLLRAALDRLMEADSPCEHCDAVLSMVIPAGSTVGTMFVVHEDDCDAA
jgi:hypothetical protein